MLPTKHAAPFSREGWIFEPKWDGYRALCFLENGTVRFFSRQNRELTNRFPDLSTIGHAMKASSAIIDGEIVALDDNDLPCFPALQSRRKCYVVYYAFDLLTLNGGDLRGDPLLVRKKTLKRILKKAPRLRYTDHFVGKGEELFAALEQMGLEGMVAKKADSLYMPGRSKLWLKIKTEAGKVEMKKRIETWGHR
jgi:bifunctional non-homologous end joining protein LigD